MGRRFIDKKKSATFQLLASVTAAPNHEEVLSADRVFVRVDNNRYEVQGLGDGESSLHDGVGSIFADAPGDEESDVLPQDAGVSSNLPDHIRRQILELGFPDDGYNYLVHLKDVRNTGGGSVVHHNSKARLDQIPLDIKAYDASGVEVKEVHNDPTLNPILSIAAETVGIRAKNSADSDVIAMLNGDALSNLCSGMDDLEEDFVLQANLPDEDDGYGKLQVANEVEDGNEVEALNSKFSVIDENPSDEQRIWRPLDEQFELIECNEYGTDREDGHSQCLSEDDLIERKVFGLSVETLDTVLSAKEHDDMIEVLPPAADVIQRCFEYVEKYENEIDSETLDDSCESSDGSESWDCETIISTYSNLDNHPAKIESPEIRRKKLAEKLSKALNMTGKLRGNDKISTELFKGHPKEKKSYGSSRIEHNRRERHGRESKEAKKERKDAVKHERREARRAKKEMKEVYRCEIKRAQRVAAISGPPSIHIL